mmetsp:Transcript_39102/g.98288  ORF Transcript_39102/g.98288 Transcript_39102/m.98288 type:complete len:200 (-) Transcript_39102:261-860(-)
MTFSSGPSSLRPSMSASSSSCSHASLSAALMSTSGSRMGTKPLAMTRLPISNCCLATALMPASLALLMTERSFVPKIPAATPRSSNSSSIGMSFMSWTPSFSSARPLSIFRKGTTFFCSHKYLAEGMPPISRSIVASNKIAPKIRAPLNLGFLMIRLRISCILSIISVSPVYSLSAMPYSRRAFPVLPPLWSSAAKNPS